MPTPYSNNNALNIIEPKNFEQFALLYFSTWSEFSAFNIARSVVLLKAWQDNNKKIAVI